MSRFTRFTLSFLATSVAALSYAQADVNVVTSIKPVHSLVAKVMKGAGEPELIIKDTSSPHEYILKPSDAKLLQEADLVFWVGKDIESFLIKPIESLPKTGKSVSLLEDTHDLIKKAYRENLSPEGAHDDHHDKHDHEKHGHDEHKHEEHHDDHAKHDDHGHKDEHAHKDEHKHDHDKHDHEKHGHDEHKHEKHHDDHAKHEKHDDHGHKDEHAGHHDHHHHGEFDGHIWLDPVNAQHIVEEISERLEKADPDNAALYKKNAKAAIKELDALEHEIEHKLESYHDAKFVVFHDAYQYFESRFGLKASGTVTVNLESGAGAQHLKELRHDVEEHKITCLFSEPQFPTKLVQTVQEGTNLKVGVLDPIGANLEPGPGLYNELLEKMASSMANCFKS